MRGVQFVTDAQGERVAVVLDLKEWRDLWEDVYDTMIAMERKGEPTIPLDDFDAALRTEGLLSE